MSEDHVRSNLPSIPAGAVLDSNVIADLRSLSDSAGDGFLGELAGLFLLDASTRISDLHVALDAGDGPGVFGAAHTLAGSAANLGANHLSMLCAALADVCRYGAVDGARSTLELIDLEFERVEPAVQELVEAG